MSPTRRVATATAALVTPLLVAPLLVVGLLAGLLVAGTASHAGAVRDAPHPARDAATLAASPAARPIAGPSGVRTVVAVSIDGLNPEAIRELGPEGAPTLHRLMAEGASTLDARSSVKRTETLPNHTGMLTGRNIDKRWRGHGIEFNTLMPGRIDDYAGRHVSSAYEVVGWHGGEGGLFASKDKFVLFKRTWSGPIKRYVFDGSNDRITSAAIGDLYRAQREFRLLHLSDPDVAGHADGFMSASYLEAVRDADHQLGRLVDAVAQSDFLRRKTVLVVTSDHGGRGDDGHAQAGRPENYRVPFIVWGRGVSAGADLYDLNPDYADPGTSRPGWGAEPQPVRNTDVANLSLGLLGLPPVPGSRADHDQDLDVLPRDD